MKIPGMLMLAKSFLRISRELSRLNDNVERVLEWQKVPQLASADERAAAASERSYIGAPLTEEELAIIEYLREQNEGQQPLEGAPR